MRCQHQRPNDEHQKLGNENEIMRLHTKLEKILHHHHGCIHDKSVQLGNEKILNLATTKDKMCALNITSTNAQMTNTSS